MGKKKREHIVFDQMLKQKKSIPFSIINKNNKKNKPVKKGNIKKGIRAYSGEMKNSIVVPYIKLS